MSLAGIKLRSHLVNCLRELLQSQGFDEYLPQIAAPTQPLEPTIYPFISQWDRLPGNPTSSALYLATSPEGYLKQVLAAGSNRCFAISHAFRNLEGEGPLHQPEFLMAEWYQQDADWREMMHQTQNIVTSIWEKCDAKNKLPATGKWPIVSYRDLWQQYLDLDLDTLLDDGAMIAFAQKQGYQTAGATWEQLFNQIVFNHIEPLFSASPFFLIDYPSRISPLAKPQTASPEFAARFELIINRIELANGNTENTNVNSIKTMMETEQQSRSADSKIPPLDTDFLNSLSRLQTHQWAGVGLGLDRLAMLIGGHKSIRDIQWP